MSKQTAVFVISSLLLIPAWVFCQQKLPYKNASLPVEVRVKDLLKRMTPDEKLRQLFMVAGDLGKNPNEFKGGLFGFSVNTAGSADNEADKMLEFTPGRNAVSTAKKINAVQKFIVEESRLGIPIIAFEEALHGVVRTDATAFPQSIALAATWDTTLVNNVAHAIALECKLRGWRQILSPVINLATDVRWGRVEETYGEDPVLTAAMGIAFIRAFEEMGIVTTPKHFAVNHGEGGRDSYPIDFNERILHETYLLPFKEVVQKAGARSIMTAYNALNGRPCTANDWLLNKVLKKDWGFKGFVISDAAATGGQMVSLFTAKDYGESGKQAIENGLDVIFQIAFDSYPLFSEPFLKQKVNQKKLDSAVARVLRIKFELGLFENPYIPVPAETDNANLLTVNRKLAQEAAAKSLVLLKNDDKKILPLAASYKNITIVGTDAVEARLGGYSGIGNKPVSLLAAMQEKLSGKANITFAPGCGRQDTSWNIIAPDYFSHIENGVSAAGLQGEYFNNIDFKGKPALSRIDANINFQWTLFSPHPSIQYDFFSCRWNGIFTSPVTGTFKIGIDGNDGYRLFINDNIIIDNWNGQAYNTTLVDYAFEKDKKYKIKIEYKEAAGNAWFRLIWDVFVKNQSQKRIEEAVKAAAQSDVIIVAAGIDEGEFQDRSYLKLPGSQEAMIEELCKLGKPVVVLLYGGSAVTMSNWLHKVNAVLDVWYPGDAGGYAVADALLGITNPSGKLPITFPVTEGQLPLVYNHKPTGRGDDYRDGTGQALFPFGFGMSYTTFEYSDLFLSKTVIDKREKITVRFTIKNTGSVAGDEVAQLYLRDEVASVVRPVKELKTFKRITLQPGEQKTISFIITPQMLTMLDENLKPVVEPGAFRIMIGGSSKDIRLRGVINVK